jgi:hypothetical protein
MRPRIGFGRGKGDEAPKEVDATAWLIHSPMAEFVLLHTVYIKYMVMFGYTYLHGAFAVYSISTLVLFHYSFSFIHTSIRL